MTIQTSYTCELFCSHSENLFHGAACLHLVSSLKRDYFYDFDFHATFPLFAAIEHHCSSLVASTLDDLDGNGPAYINTINTIFKL